MNNQIVKYLNGDAGLFFKNKIKALKDDSFIIDYISKRKNKKYTVSAYSNKGEIIKRYIWIDSYIINDDNIKIYVKSDLDLPQSKTSINLYFQKNLVFIKAKDISWITY